MDLFGLIVSILLLLLGVGSFVFSRRIPSGDSYEARRRADAARGGFRGIAVILVILAGLIGFADSSVIIGARSLGVQTSFGRVTGTPLQSGFHWVAPWHSVETFDASVQTMRYYQNEKSDDGDCITVRLGNSTQACVDVTLQWNINHKGDVNGLYLAYKTPGNIHDNVVRRQLGSALNEIFGTYDPLAALGTGDTPTVTTKDLQERVAIALARDLGGDFTVDSVTIPIVHFDPDTETRLKAFQQAKGDTRIAGQQALTAQQQADAAKLLAQQPGIEKPGVRYQNCLNLIANLARLDQLKNLPPTFNCNDTASSPNLLLPTK